MTARDEKKWLRRNDLARRFGVAPITILRWANDPNHSFPPATNLSAGLTAWPKDAVEEFERRCLGLAD